MSVKLLIEHHLEFVSLKGGYTGSLGTTIVKIPHCCKSHVAAESVISVYLHSLYISTAENPGHQPFDLWNKNSQVSRLIFGPCREKTCLRDFRQSEIQTSLLSYGD